MGSWNTLICFLTLKLTEITIQLCAQPFKTQIISINEQNSTLTLFEVGSPYWIRIKGQAKDCSVSRFKKQSLSLSLRRGGGGYCSPPPFRIFPRTIFAFLLRLPYGQFTHPLSRYPYIYGKNFQKFLPWKNLGGGGGLQQLIRPEREGVAAKINKFS